MADLLTTRQVQELLKVDRTTIYRMVDSGQLPAIRVGKQWRFARTDLDRLLTQGAAPAAGGKKQAPPSGKQPVAPTIGDASYPLHELLPLAAAQMIQDVIADALGVTMIITDMQGHPATQVSNPCGLYRVVLADDDAVTRCIQEWQRMAGVATLEPKFMPNDMGLLCARGLIRFGHQLKGMVFIGGIAPEKWPPNQENVMALANHFQLPRQELTAHIGEVFYLDRRQRDYILSFVQRAADLFSLLVEDRSALLKELSNLQTLLPDKEQPEASALHLSTPV